MNRLNTKASISCWNDTSTGSIQRLLFYAERAHQQAQYNGFLVVKLHKNRLNTKDNFYGEMAHKQTQLKIHYINYAKMANEQLQPKMLLFYAEMAHEQL